MQLTQKIRDFRVLSPKWDVYISYLLSRLKDLSKEEDKRLLRTTVVDDLKKTVFQVQKADVHIWTANDYDKLHKTCKNSSQTKPLHGEMELDINSHSCLRSFDIWLLLEEGELAFFNGMAPGILITLQGKPHAQER